jgi:two-component system response regulator ResD
VRISAVEPTRLLVVDDDPVAREFVSQALATIAVEVEEADDAPAALDLLRQQRYVCVVVDVNLPTMSGITLLERIRERHEVALVIHTAVDDPSFAVVALEAGADEFCTKPLSDRELVLRVQRAVERHQMVLRTRPRVAMAVSAGGLVVDPSARAATLDGVDLELTASEFELLRVLASSPGKVFTRGELLALVWADDADRESVDIVTEHVYRLRHKLDLTTSNRSWIETVRGAGYRFAPPAEGMESAVRPAVG